VYSVRDDQFLEVYNVIHLDGKSLQLECDTLDNILDTEKVDVIKMDIEGAEALALKAATKTMENIRKIVVETHGDTFEKVQLGNMNNRRINADF
jgi:FkbM family methyltransferase